VYEVKADYNTLINLDIRSHEYLQNDDFDKAQVYAERLLYVAKELGSYGHMARAYSRLGYVEFQQKKYNKSLENYIWQVYYAEKNEDELLIAEGYDNIAKVFYLAGDMTNAYTFYDKSSGLWRHLCDGVRAAESFRSKGLVLQHQKEYDKAFYAFQEGLKYGEALENKDMIADSYNHIGALYYVQNKLDSAKEYYYKSLALKEEKVDIALAYVYFNLGLIAVKEEKWEEAYAYFLRSEAIAKAEKDSDMIASNDEQLANILLHQHNPSKALGYLEEGLALSKQIDNAKLQSGIEELLITCYHQLKKTDEAQAHYQSHTSLQASISKTDQQAALDQQQNCQELLKTYTSTTKEIRVLWWKWLWAKGVEATSGLFVLLLGFAVVRWVVKLVKHTKDHLKIMDVVIAMLDKYLSDWDEWPKLRRRLTNVGNHLNRLTAWVGIFRKRSN
jgi:tetratricopeptide (TPR) repeat protein